MSKFHPLQPFLSPILPFILSTWHPFFDSFFPSFRPSLLSSLPFSYLPSCLTFTRCSHFVQSILPFILYTWHSFSDSFSPSFRPSLFSSFPFLTFLHVKLSPVAAISCLHPSILSLHLTVLHHSSFPSFSPCPRPFMCLSIRPRTVSERR